MAFCSTGKLCLGDRHVLTFKELYEKLQEETIVTCLGVKDSHLIVQDVLSVRELVSHVTVIITYDDDSKDIVTENQVMTDTRKGIIRAEHVEKFDQIKSAMKRSGNGRFYKVVRNVLKFHEETMAYEVETKDCDNLVTTSGVIMKTNM